MVVNFFLRNVIILGVKEECEISSVTNLIILLTKFYIFKVFTFGHSCYTEYAEYTFIGLMCEGSLEI